MTVEELLNFLAFQKSAGRGDCPVYIIVSEDAFERLEPINTIRLCESYTALDADRLTEQRY